MWGRLPGVTVAAGVLAIYLVLGLPMSGVLARRELHSRRCDPGLRQTIYRHAMRRLWLLAGLAIGLAGLAKLPLTTLGLRAPAMAEASPPGPLAGAVLLAATSTALLVLATGQVGTAGPVAQTLLPRTRDERRLFVVVAFTAGAAEELLFRGFLITYVTGALGWSVQGAAAASALAFGLSHLYQGHGTALAAGVIGYGFAETYVLTGSLLLPVAVHIALDLRLLRVRVEAGAENASEMQGGEQALEPVT